MKDYYKRDYALNKKSESIVYQSVTGKIIEISKDVFLASDPALTEEDFDIWKKISDEMLLETDRADYRQEYNNISINSLEGTADCAVRSLDDEYIKIQNQTYTVQAVRELLKSGVLTPTQHRRLILYYQKGMTLEKIAEQEGVSAPSVWESLIGARDKIKNHFRTNN